MKHFDEIKTIDIQAKEWFDKVNGNSYFAAKITVNYCMNDECTLIVPFQYGYGEQYEFVCETEIKRNYRDCPTLRDLRQKGVITRISKRDALKRELKQLESQNR